MKNEFDIPPFLSRRPFSHYAATNWRHFRWDFTAKIRLCYHLRYRQDACCQGEWTYTPVQKQSANEKQVWVNGWSGWITGRGGHNEIITSKHCARGAPTVLETDYLCWACERGRDAGNVKKHGWKELIVRHCNSGSGPPSFQQAVSNPLSIHSSSFLASYGSCLQPDLQPEPMWIHSKWRLLVSPGNMSFTASKCWWNCDWDVVSFQDCDHGNCISWIGSRKKTT